LTQALLVGLGGDLEREVADLELGGAEEGLGVAVEQGAGDLEQLLLGRFGDGGGQLARLGFPLRGGFFHRGISDSEGRFLVETPRR